MTNKKINSKVEKEGIKKKDYSDISLISFGFGGFIGNYITIVFNTWIFFFYEVVLGLDIFLVSIGFIIYGIWNAINDPIIGYLTNKKTRLTEKWGRRFPWVIIGVFSWAFSIVLILSTPVVNPESQQLILFVWLVFSTCLHDTFLSIWSINSSGIYFTKYRSQTKRRRLSGLRTPLGALGQICGSLIPPLIIISGNKQSFVNMAWISCLIGIIGGSLMIYGHLEDKEIIKRDLLYFEKHDKSTSFLNTVKSGLKNRNFITYNAYYIFRETATLCLLGSIPYIMIYLLNSEFFQSIYILGSMTLGVIASIPFWYKIAERLNDNRKIIIIGTLFSAICLFPLIFVNDLIGIIVVIIFYGIAQGSWRISVIPLLGDIIDELTIETKKRNEGLFIGVNSFIERFSIVIQALVFGIVHILTGFDPSTTTQTQLAQFGVRMHAAILPVIFLFIGGFILWLFLNITQEKVQLTKAKLEELNL